MSTFRLRSSCSRRIDSWCCATVLSPRSQDGVSSKNNFSFSINWNVKNILSFTWKMAHHFQFKKRNSFPSSVFWFRITEKENISSREFLCMLPTLWAQQSQYSDLRDAVPHTQDQMLASQSVFCCYWTRLWIFLRAGVEETGFAFNNDPTSAAFECVPVQWLSGHRTVLGVEVLTVLLGLEGWSHPINTTMLP